MKSTQTWELQQSWAMCSIQNKVRSAGPDLEILSGIGRLRVSLLIKHRFTAPCNGSLGSGTFLASVRRLPMWNWQMPLTTRLPSCFLFFLPLSFSPHFLLLPPHPSCKGMKPFLRLFWYYSHVFPEIINQRIWWKHQINTCSGVRCAKFSWIFSRLKFCFFTYIIRFFTISISIVKKFKLVKLSC